VTDDSPITRVARHLALPQIGKEGQAKIASSTVLLIGVGGIGCATATYLASSGVGRLLLVDFDTVDATNLGRQTLYSPADIGKSKAECAQVALQRLNPDIDVVAISERLSGDALLDAVKSADVVLDGSDNFPTRFEINEACFENKRCLVSAAAIRFEGQLAVFGPDFDKSPCYRCLYVEADESLENCSGNGVLSPVPGVMGTLAATECLKVLVGIPPNNGRLMLFDALSSEWQNLSIRKNEDCPTCGNR
jgi:molybdopterin/thiamine biosynthesis adenylyltransferase